MRDDFKKYLTGAILAGAVMAPGAVWAQTDDPADAGAIEEDLDEAVEEDLESGEAAEKPWTVSATLLTRAYQGMFADPANQDPALDPRNGQAGPASAAFDRWLNLYVVSAGYSYEDFSFGADLTWSHWMTRGGGSVEPNEFRFEDTGLSASWSGYEIEPIDTTVSARYSATLPTSLESRTSNLIVGNTLTTSASKTFFEKLTLSYSLAGSWTPHTTEMATNAPDTVQILRETDPLTTASGEFPDNEYYNSQFALTNALSASIPVWDKLNASISYSLTKYWTYHVDNDDALAADIDGIQTGRMTSDVSIAAASLSYPIGDYVNVSGGIRTAQAPKTSDNSSFRFPWWDTTSAASNRSAFQLAITGTY
ncbi:hypothetical protein FIV42_20005 [Persicimonas caeni]|uniref:Uncharacterized protein n=1 Tax=Persicimonas caeni TaxID=2292766 RepID=A0A4Y6PXF6_PERCE|nr:hypothetical protein [Persicimonas caeni]QDG52943.1 hypothetical protein FIV42_20005 [Persicimonas caeni]QED34165.1 hypothetical protein FRD00_20000 [Persicimonas caeni]